MEHHDITEEQLLAYAERFKDEKGFNAPHTLLAKKHFVNSINLLLCHMETPKDLFDCLVGIKIFLERVDLIDDCYAAVDLKTWRPFIEMYEE